MKKSNQSVASDSREAGDLDLWQNFFETDPDASDGEMMLSMLKHKKQQDLKDKIKWFFGLNFLLAILMAIVYALT